MNRFYGKVGYVIPTENPPGVWKDIPVERPHYGDVVRNTSNVEVGSGLNDDVVINNSISIVADPFAYENFQHMRYVEWMGTLWKIKTVEVQYPRLLLTIGGVYNGERP